MKFAATFKLLNHENRIFFAALKVSCKLNEAWSETAKHNIQLVEGDYFPIAERVNGNRCYKKTVRFE